MLTLNLEHLQIEKNVSNLNIENVRIDEKVLVV